MPSKDSAVFDKKCSTNRIVLNTFLYKTMTSLTAWFTVHFGMSHALGGPKIYEIFKHEQPATGVWPIIVPITI